MMPPSPILHIDLDSRISAYEQIAAELRAFLVEGRVGPGDRLPTVRRLAMDLGVHHNTVAQAYRRLADEGWLELRRGRGVRVLRRPDPRPTADAMKIFSRQLKRLVAQALSGGLPPRSVARELVGRAKRFPKGSQV